MAAVLVAERHADRDVDEAEIRIRRVGRPRVVLADARRADLRAVLPRVGAELAGLRNQVELPQLLAGPDVEAANPAGQVPEPRRVVAVNVRAADDDDVADDDRRAAGGDLAERRIDADRAVGAGPRLRIPGLARLGLARRRGVADLEGPGVVDGERHERETQAFHQIDDAVLADGGSGLPVFASRTPCGSRA